MSESPVDSPRDSALGARATQHEDRPANYRAQTPREELLNAGVHGLALIVCLVAVPSVVIAPALQRDGWQGFAACIFGASLVLLYASSTVYHALPPSPLKRLFRLIDHSAIYLLIAGTYSPFALGALRGSVGWPMFGLLWGLAALGILFKTVFGHRFDKLSTALYVAMGWIAIVAVKPMMQHISPEGLGWLLAGGVSYTGGVFFYLLNRVKFAHAVWHLCVAGGSLCHVIAVVGHAAGRG